eukprot:TRINITY_DN5551_c0_g2_i1.p1 TRINITY_DN5551_c0_g2~~TRINITY_DN5551_c0_g2_i1.p1  ORF type:complete len:330 (-),score=74.90 TRINITY_DN5551_c0_g2_i1:24-1013(-)
MRHFVFGFVLVCLISLCNGFYNPIIQKGADPWIISWKNRYYYCKSAGNSIEIWSSENLDNWEKSTKKTVHVPSHFTEIWAPELHLINNEFYIYVAADTEGKNERHRMFVFSAKNHANPMGEWELKGKLSTEDDNWAIDGTVFKFPGNNKLYFIWSGWSSPALPKIQNLYIAELSNPFTVSSKRVLLRTPNQPWMKFEAFGINEGPEILIKGNRTFLIYSASASWTEHYCLGLMGIEHGKNPMVPSDWWRKEDGPVMKSAPQNSVYGPGHASFVDDRGGKTWIVYHAISKPDAGWAGRSVRIQSIGYNADGAPQLPVPLSTKQRILPNPK